MLSHLHISHYALIESLDLDLATGYSVITGETGAGKSILLGALGLLLGARADARVVKVGEQKCVVEATFSIEGMSLASFFEENDIDYDPAECVIRRELTAAGKSRAFVNDTPVVLSVLKTLGAYLVDIHSQHQNQLLGSEEYLLQTLDLVAANEQVRQDYASAFSAYQQAQKDYARAQQMAQHDAEQQELLQHQQQLLLEFAPREGEQEELETEQSLLSHAEEIKGSLYEAAISLDSDECNVLQHLRQCGQALERAAQHFPEVGALAERIESARIELDDILEEVQQHVERVEFNPQRLQYVDDRLSAMYQLQKRFGVTTDAELVAKLQELTSRLEAVGNIDIELQRLEKLTSEAYHNLQKQGAALTATRKQAAEKIATALTDRIHTLGMPYGQVIFALQECEPTPQGMNQLQLMFSANKNVPVQNVQDIASGGEVARLMLALKTYTAQYRQLPTIVFDEIDTGVSGTMAEKMGQLMQELSAHCQVICITHLPQIAALGQHHFLVYKEEEESETLSHIIPLSPEQRVSEIANMLSGAELTDAALENARTLLKNSIK